MNLEEVEGSLPNGFHDSQIKSISIDYLTGTATFDLEVWVGEDEAKSESEREAYRHARLVLSDLLFCVIEPPETHYEKKALWVDAGARNSAPISTSIELPSPLPENAFIYWFFVNNWNSFIHVAALEAHLHFS